MAHVTPSTHGSTMTVEVARVLWEELLEAVHSPDLSEEERNTHLVEIATELAVVGLPARRES